MTALRLEEPTVARAESYRGLVREFLDRGEPLVPFTLRFPNDDFPAFLATLAACARGEGLPEGHVPHSTYWLVRDDADVVGVANFRHRLTDALRRIGGHIGYGIRPSARGNGYAKEILRQTLVRAAAFGITEAWLTCDKENEPSARTILANGGELVSEAFVPEMGEIVQRYRIAIPNARR